MAMFLRAARLPLSLVSLMLIGCGPTPAPAQAKAEPAKAEPSKAEPPAAPAEPLTVENDPGLKPTLEPLTAEEQRLIAADPKSLSPEESRLRAHALRRKIMINPTSEQAKALQDARAAVLSGEADPTGAAPGETKDPGLVLEAPELAPK